MGEERRVVVTGIGPITPIGTGVEGFWQGLKQRRSAVGPITRFDPTPFKSRIAAQVDDFHPTDHIEERRARRFDRYSQLAVAATRLAAGDSALDLAREDPDRIGVMMGTALGGISRAEEEHGHYVAGGLKAVDPSLALSVFAGASSCNVAIEFGVTGPNSTNGMSCASGTIAIGEGLRAIRRGEADVMLAGGAEAPLAPLCFGSFAIIRAMSTRNDDPATASRPFDAARDGFVMAEGATILVLEERSRAIARGAPIYAEICGYGLTNDAHHMTAPRPDGQPGGAGHAPGAGRRARGAARGPVPQRPRLLDAAQRPHRELRRSTRSSATTRPGSRSAAPRATTATPSVRAGRSRPRSAAWPGPAAGCRRR